MRTLLATLALTLVAASQAPAQTVSGSVSDYSFDYDLYAAEWETNWYTIVLWDNGTVSEYWSASPESANQFAIWLWLHYVEVKDIDIISRVEPGEWQYVSTFDKRATLKRPPTSWKRTVWPPTSVPWPSRSITRTVSTSTSTRPRSTPPSRPRSDSRCGSLAINQPPVARATRPGRFRVALDGLAGPTSPSARPRSFSRRPGPPSAARSPAVRYPGLGRPNST